MAAQATAVPAAKVTEPVTAAPRRPVHHNSTANSSTAGCSAAARPMSTPPPRRSSWRCISQPRSTSRTGSTLVCPAVKALRTGTETTSRISTIGSPYSAVRRETGPGNARTATTPTAATSSRVPNVQARPSWSSAARAKGRSTSPAKGVPVNGSAPPYSESPARHQANRSAGREASAACRRARAPATSQSPASAIPPLVPSRLTLPACSR